MADEKGKHVRPELTQTRLAKAARLRELGVNPYPYTYRPTHTAGEILGEFDQLAESETCALAGRIMALRPMGKATFAQLQDRSARIQLYFRKDELGELPYEILAQLDLGDLIGVRGTPFRTRTGEPTIRVTDLTVLCKAIAPLPVEKERDGQTFDAWEDVEARYRSRHLDLLLHPETRRTFELRSMTIRALRRFLDDRGFLEVETPVLQAIYGGAMARPFTTWHNALGLKLYLRIAEELPLKKLLVGGFDRVYEIGRVFRNEGMDRNHSPEFTMLEFYWAWADYRDAMDLVEEMLRETARAAAGTLRFQAGGGEIDFEAPFARRPMAELIFEKTGLDVLQDPEGKLRGFLEAKEVELPPYAGRGHMIEALFDAEVQPGLVHPTFVTDHPREISPLAKAHRERPDLLVERFELFIGGHEFANAFSELNDPVDQRRRFEDQARLRTLGDEEAQVLDESFLSAIDAGMPPAAGVGIGVDRLVMLLSGMPNIRDVVLFPHMRPEEGKPEAVEGTRHPRPENAGPDGNVSAGRVEDDPDARAGGATAP